MHCSQIQTFAAEVASRTLLKINEGSLITSNQANLFLSLVNVFLS